MWKPRCLITLWASAASYRDSFAFYTSTLDLFRHSHNVTRRGLAVTHFNSSLHHWIGNREKAEIRDVDSWWLRTWIADTRTKSSHSEWILLLGWTYKEGAWLIEWLIGRLLKKDRGNAVLNNGFQNEYERGIGRHGARYIEILSLQ
jgi:hypothetical protein